MWCGLDTKKIKVITADYTLEDDVDVVILAASGTNRTVTMPTTAVTGRTVYFKDRADNAAITVYSPNKRMMAANSIGYVDSLAVNNISCFFVFDGSYWI